MKGGDAILEPALRLHSHREVGARMARATSEERRRLLRPATPQSRIRLGIAPAEGGTVGSVLGAPRCLLPGAHASVMANSRAQTQCPAQGKGSSDRGRTPEMVFATHLRCMESLRGLDVNIKALPGWMVTHFAGSRLYRLFYFEHGRRLLLLSHKADAFQDSCR